MSKLALPGFRGEHPLGERPAMVHIDAFTCVVSVRATVIGETPKRYRVRFDEDGPGFGGYRRKGTTHLVPKGSVTFATEEKQAQGKVWGRLVDVIPEGEGE